MKKISVLIADDHLLLRQGLSQLLNSNSRFEVVGATGCGVHAVALAAALRPNVVLLDLNLPRLNGVEATRRICEQAPRTHVLALSLRGQWGLARLVLQQGATGYLTKRATRSELMRALELVSQGCRYICHELQEHLCGEEETPSAVAATLTQREREVIAHVCKGNSSKEIARILHLSQKTVETHRYHILKKLGLNCTTALIDFAHRHGLEREYGPANGRAGTLQPATRSPRR